MYNLSAIWQKRGYLNIGKGAWCQKLDLRTCRLRPVRRRLCPLRSTCIHMHWHHRGVIPLKYLLRVQRINLLHSHQMNLLKHSSLRSGVDLLYRKGQLTGSTISLFDVTKSNDSDCFEFGPDSTSLIQAAFVPKSNVKINLKFAFWTPPIPPGSFSKAANLISNLKSRGKFSRSERQNSLIARWSRSVGFEWPRKT